MFAKSAALLATLSLAASPALAQPSAAPIQGQSRLEGQSILPIILLVAILTGGVLLATGVIGDNDHPPVSP